MEILALENVFFPDRKERPEEAPFVAWKKTFSRARLEWKAGNSSRRLGINKNYSFALNLFLMMPFRITVNRIIAEPM